MNKLYHKLTRVLRKQGGANSSVIPFALGRIYKTRYRNWHNDPRPLVLILGSDAFYTVGINLNYIPNFQSQMINFIMLMRESKKVLTGYIIYQMIKRRLPVVPRVAFRKYFTSMLRGRLVSEGISTMPEPNVSPIADPFIRRLQGRIRPRIFSHQKEQVNNDTVDDVRNQIETTQYGQDQQKPFSDRTVVEYGREQQEGGISRGLA